MRVSIKGFALTAGTLWGAAMLDGGITGALMASLYNRLSGG